MFSSQEYLPELLQLHERHYGLTRPVCEAFAEAASVCFSRHHHSPVNIEIKIDGNSRNRMLKWNIPNARILAAWNNRDDATRDAAYSVSLAALEAEAGIVAVSRAETRTGADYYVGSPDSVNDLESCYRLEVSGVDHGGRAEVSRRLNCKIRQAKAGKSDIPAIASVVGFRELYILIQAVGDES